MAEIHRRDSFLRRAGTYDVFLDINTLPTIPKVVSDVSYTIPAKFAGRPDLLAHELYNNTRLWWVFALRNPDQLKDPLGDFKQGVEIKLPTRATVESIIG